MGFIRIIILCFSFAFLSVLLIPVFILRPFNPKNTSLFFWILKNILVPIMGIEYEVRDEHRLQDNLPAVLVGNHQSNWDIFTASVAFEKNVVSLGKSQIAFIPLFGQLFLLGGNIGVNRSNKTKAKQSLEKVKKILKRKKVAFIIFPEGHRNSTGKLLKFKMGAFRTAIETQVPLVPFSVNLFSKSVDLNKKKSMKIIVQFHEPISTAGHNISDLQSLSDRCKLIIQNGMDELNRNNLS